MGVLKPNFRYEQTNDSKYKQGTQELVEHILSQEYGTTMADEDLAKILKYNINIEEEFYAYKEKMGRIKQFLLRYGYVLKGVPGIGYYILKPQQISSYCYRTYVKRAARLFDRCDFVLDRVDKTHLEGMRLEEYKNMKELNDQLIKNYDDTVFNSKYYENKNIYDFMEE